MSFRKGYLSFRGVAEMPLFITWWHIAEVAASQHFINASNGCKNTQNLSTRGKAAILAICSLGDRPFSAAISLFLSLNFNSLLNKNTKVAMTINQKQFRLFSLLLLELR
jgi:hypothetical protein